MQETRVRIRTALHSAILDPEARTIEHQLCDQSLDVTKISIERHFLVTIKADPDEALEQAKKIASTMLVNPVLHSWNAEIDTVPSDADLEKK